MSCEYEHTYKNRQKNKVFDLPLKNCFLNWFPLCCICKSPKANIKKKKKVFSIHFFHPSNWQLIVTLKYIRLHCLYVVFIFWNESEEFVFLSLYCLFTIFKGGVGIPLCRVHLILEWEEVGVRIHSPLFPFYHYI